ncbi:glycosyltransferase family 2 protein [Acinetobacter seifertii]|uniref:glycosyltransferase family 2 protein n=1 Tax=Acinetobacter seifertii TaxID=1530123 RepID=UPI0032B3B481
MVCAIIVLFNPDLIHLRSLVSVLTKQVGNIILVDNTPNNIKKYDEIYCSENVIYIDLKDNLGIARAHNEGIKEAIKLNYEYVIIFDQDSQVENDFVRSLVNIDKEIRVIDSKIAAIGPAYIDIKTNIKAPIIRFNGLKVERIQPNLDEVFTAADYIISSGTLIRTEVFQIVGLMMEELFIDYVDTEWGLRAKKKGYHCYVANKVIMHHSIGDQSLKVPFSKKYVNIHSDFRKYFIIRNAFYLVLYSNLQLNWRIVQISKTFMYFIFLCLFVSPRWNNVKIFIQAFKDAIIKKMGKGSM